MEWTDRPPMESLEWPPNALNQRADCPATVIKPLHAGVPDLAATGVARGRPLLPVPASDGPVLVWPYQTVQPPWIRLLINNRLIPIRLSIDEKNSKVVSLFEELWFQFGKRVIWFRLDLKFYDLIWNHHKSQKIQCYVVQCHCERQTTILCSHWL